MDQVSLELLEWKGRVAQASHELMLRERLPDGLDVRALQEVVYEPASFQIVRNLLYQKAGRVTYGEKGSEETEWK